MSSGLAHPPNKYIAADDDDDIDESALPAYSQPELEYDVVPSPLAKPNPNKGKARDDGNQLLSGKIGQASSSPGGHGGGGAGSSKGTTRQKLGGVSVETRYSGVDTLDEPVLTTIARDLRSIYTKLIQVLYPPRAGASREVLRDWDLWGPLILCLALGIMLSLNAPPAQSLGVFTGVVVIVSVGSLVVTLNAKLLGGRVSFFQSLCVLGYCIFPLVIAALVSTFFHALYVRGPVSLAAWAWCVWAAVNFLDGTKIEQQRLLLAVYPLWRAPRIITIFMFVLLYPRLDDLDPVTLLLFNLIFFAIICYQFRRKPNTQCDRDSENKLPEARAARFASGSAAERHK
ncbi:hypothetical protein FRB97_004919 [Tulasnella sp. 331]|nr:hypothetical protein FRB97_004919 [Tulasnella sp. 331]